MINKKSIISFYKTFIFLCLAAVVNVSIGAGEDIDSDLTQTESQSTDVQMGKRISEVESDVKGAVEKLNEIRDKIGREQRRMMSRVQELKTDINGHRDKLQSSEQNSSKLKRSIDKLEKETDYRKETLNFVADNTVEFRRSFVSGISAAQQQSIQEKLTDIDRILDNPAKRERVKALSVVLDTAVDKLSLGGQHDNRFKGKAKTASGEVVQGHFVEFGPVSYFSTPSGSIAGIARQKRGSMFPTVFQNFKSERIKQIAELVNRGRGEVPFDASGGNAIRIKETKPGLLGHLKKGRVVMIPLLLLAGVCSVLAVYKILQLLLVTKGRAENRINNILQALASGDSEQALSIAENLRKPLKPVLQEGIRFRDSSKEHLEEIMYEKLISQTPSLERFLAPLAVCASAAPLLGLLGTVTGMIHTFRLITVFGTGDAQMLSSGIAEALVTTEIGLIIAVPALLIHAYLSRRVRRSIALTQQAATTFVNGLKLKNTKHG